MSSTALHELNNTMWIKKNINIISNNKLAEIFICKILSEILADNFIIDTSYNYYFLDFSCKNIKEKTITYFINKYKSKDNRIILFISKYFRYLDYIFYNSNVVGIINIESFENNTIRYYTSIKNILTGKVELSSTKLYEYRIMNTDSISFLSILSTTEKKVFDELLLGKFNKEIASDLGMSINTVKVHIYNIFKKLKINSRIEIFKINKNLYQNKPKGK